MNNAPTQLPPPNLVSLREQVNAAAEEFGRATMFHEVWREAMDTPELHDRLGVSYATNSFRVIVTALRREMLLTLTRMWDKPKGTLRLSMIAQTIRNPATIMALAEERGIKIKNTTIKPRGVSGASVAAIIATVQESLQEKANLALKTADKYSHGGAGFPVLEKLKALRNERLAHYDLRAVAAPTNTATDIEIEEFYSDTSDLIQHLLSLVLAQAYDPKQGADVHRTYARLFWASVRGEKTEGHPNYRKPFAE